ncbi:MAG: hypothetical protein QM817_38995 [Archangium sp.]
MRLFLTSLVFVFSACEWTGRTFTASATVPVKTTAQSPLCTTSRVPVNLEDQKTFKEIEGIIGRVRVEGVSIQVNEPETPQPGVLATNVRGRVSFVPVDGSTGTPLVEFNETDLYSTFEAEIEPVTPDPDTVIENPITRPSAEAAGKVALTGKGKFQLEVATCTDANPADLELVTDLTIYLEL